MRRYDLTPLLRSSIGFDNLSRLLDQTLAADNAPAYPPYNIEKLSDDAYQISLAVAGFGAEDLTVTVEDGTLIVEGRLDDGGDDRKFLHRGIATRAFERRFELADMIKVGNAQFQNGLLEIQLEREIPEHKKPRRIDIQSPSARVKTIDANAA